MNLLLIILIIIFIIVSIPFISFFWAKFQMIGWLSGVKSLIDLKTKTNKQNEEKK
jgi:hypothetical protein